MHCPHCQQALPDEHSAANCPFCEQELARENRQEVGLAQTAHLNLPVFLAVLFAPAVCSFVALTMNMGGLASMSGVLGSLISGLICTGMIMKEFQSTGVRRALTSLAMGVLFCFLSFALSSLGCALGVNVSGHGI